MMRAGGAVRVRLSLGPGMVTRLFWLVLGLGNLSVTVLMVTLYVVTFHKSVTGDTWWKKALDIVIITMMTLVLCYFTTAFAWVGLSLASTRIWLTGTHLREFIGGRFRSVDLATADVKLTDGGKFVATDKDSGKSIEIPVTSGRVTLPSGQLQALADAVTPPGAPGASLVVAESLRALSFGAATVPPHSDPHDERHSTPSIRLLAAVDIGAVTCE